MSYREGLLSTRSVINYISIPLYTQILLSYKISSILPLGILHLVDIITLRKEEKKIGISFERSDKIEIFFCR